MNTVLITLPIAPGEVARLQVAIPMTQEKWEQMLRVLAAMKEGIVSEQEDEGIPEDTGSIPAPPTKEGVSDG